jgi:hypothetical protein
LSIEPDGHSAINGRESREQSKHGFQFRIPKNKNPGSGFAAGI